MAEEYESTASRISPRQPARVCGRRVELLDSAGDVAGWPPGAACAWVHRRQFPGLFALFNLPRPRISG
jgi:hypothetical protein